MSQFFMFGDMGELINKNHVVRVCQYPPNLKKGDPICDEIDIQLSNGEVIIEVYESQKEMQSRFDELCILLMGLSASLEVLS